ncbi:hypothetical protein SSBR45G_42540 [Bradyrhizobium sp. SSBR45G]|uniref:hypothetical protein n=1 Tax=unclassified Bradyrhizobium TaxID=2631580 RepID=UPI002342A1B2|nr:MULTISPECIES: hypothetical protein [unclassified Bradyrhizobium]GLH79345.1 hypothetical protein SSBR45G_42540 [Bradyrhizobium sp. SSBR45G]GLH86719.1 hypothetical protein SSBR45R_41790 [Bradyrhizobium sp. SSBR45R]
MVPSFLITKSQLENANPFFQPATAPALPPHATVVPPTRVWISTASVEVDLVATFLPATPVANGVARVAGLQTVTSNVAIDFSTILPLYWMASVLKNGELAPNTSYVLYSSDDDSFRLVLNASITVTHGKEGWLIPAYDSQQYTVNVGFGVGVPYVAWGYSIQCAPQARVVVKAGSYELVRSNGTEVIGAPVPTDSPSWPMPIGHDYTLVFDSSGNGVLTPV